jgi:transposase
VKQRLAVVSFMQTRGVRSAARHFGLTRLTVREWRDRWRQAGLAGLVPRYPARRRRRVPAEVVELVRKARVDLEYGAARTRIWLLRVHQVRLAQATIQRVFRDIGIPRLRRGARRSRPRQMKLFEKEHPGDSVQVDVKVVKIGANKGYQYTALDDCTRYRVLRLYRRCNQESSRDFFAELRAALPFPIRQLQKLRPFLADARIAS